MTTTSLADAKNHLSEIVASAEKTQERTTITKNGRPVAVILSIEDLETLEATLDALSIPGIVNDIREAEEELKRGETVPHDVALADVAEMRRASEV